MAGPASAQVLAFAARRLLADPVALIFATRDPDGEFTGLLELVVQGLGDADARALLGSFLRVRLDERVFDRIVAETWGNPLALLELPRGLTPEDLAGGFGVLSAPGLPRPSAAGTSPMWKECAGSGSSARSPSSGWDWETWRLFCARQVSLARDADALVALPLALITLSTLLAWTGDFAAAAPLLEEAEEINEATRSQLHFQPYAALQIAAWQATKPRPWH